MNRFIGLIIMVVAVAALAGAAIGWRFPFLGSRSANQIEASQDGKQAQSTTQKQSLRAKQPLKQARNTSASGTKNLQAQNTTVDTGTTVDTQSSSSQSNQPIPALW